MLYFESLQDFQRAFSYISARYNEGEVFLKAEEFKSFTHAFDEACTKILDGETNLEPFRNILFIEEYMGEKYVEPAISSPAAGILFNHMGMIRIEDRIYMHKEDKVLVYNYKPTSKGLF